MQVDEMLDKAYEEISPAKQMAKLMQRRSELDRELGKQHMQTAILKWSIANSETLASVGLLGSLSAALDAARQS